MFKNLLPPNKGPIVVSVLFIFIFTASLFIVFSLNKQINELTRSIKAKETIIKRVTFEWENAESQYADLSNKLFKLEFAAPGIISKFKNIPFKCYDKLENYFSENKVSSVLPIKDGNVILICNNQENNHVFAVFRDRKNINVTDDVSIPKDYIRIYQFSNIGGELIGSDERDLIHELVSDPTPNEGMYNYNVELAKWYVNNSFLYKVIEGFQAGGVQFWVYFKPSYKEPPELLEWCKVNAFPGMKDWSKCKNLANTSNGSTFLDSK